MNKLLDYIRQYGIIRTCRGIYEFALFNYLCRFMGLFLKNRKLENIILLESHDDFDCNAGALYNYLINNHYNQKYKIVWQIKRRCKVKLPDNVTTVRLFCPSIRRAYYSWTAKYIFSDSYITKKRRKDQISVYLTHGAIGLKSVKGREVVDETVDYVLAGSPNYDYIYRNELSLKQHQKLLYFNFPCVDIFFEESESELKKFVCNKYNKIVLWMPTFRKGGRYERNDSDVELPLGIPIIENHAMLSSMNKFLIDNKTLMVIKLHPSQSANTYKRLHSMSNIIVITGDDVKRYHINTYAMVKEVDALITDYSSIAFQFIMLHRPLAFVFSDLKNYRIGLAVDDLDFYLAGPVINTFDELKSFIINVCCNKDLYEEKRNMLVDWLYVYKNGGASKRIVDFFNL